MANVKFNNVSKIFGKFEAVKNVSLEVNDKEFLCLVGPSGCGKSTCLNMVAGLEVPTIGRITIGDNVVAADDEIIIPPHLRDIAMVFQSYALYPHYNVRENLTFGLNLAQIPQNSRIIASILQIIAVVFFQLIFFIAVPFLGELAALAFGIMGFPSVGYYYTPVIFLIEIPLLIVFLSSAKLRRPVFQRYLSLFKFIEPIRVLLETKVEIDRRAEEVAQMLNIQEILNKKPSQLSGGQQQRVSLGRAIIREPQVFLLDEPLSNLDARLRTVMRAEIAALQRRLGVTTLYVTHDQVEALTMADRIAVMRDGIIHQIGTPEEVYDKPADIFVASFLGSPPINFLYDVKKENNLYNAGGISVKLTSDQERQLEESSTSNYVVAVRSENLIVSRQPTTGSGENFLDVKLFEKGEVKVIEQLGSESLVHVIIKDSTLIAKVPPLYEIAIGSEIYLAIKPGSAHFFDKETELRIF